MNIPDTARNYLTPQLIFSRAPKQSAQDIAILVERALLDQTVDWPSSSVSLGNISFQIQVDNLGSNRFKITWWNSDAANSRRKIKLTFNAGDGTRLYGVVTSPQTRGNAEVTKRGTQFRAIFDQEFTIASVGDCFGEK
ncbi:unnamed protein product [Clonostachys rhizophaga]|uniref:Uncharacterized protein n=1 Tax=Clonostachys rhizophaga TaxID=160324 RepID=A0A9N9YM84_9HYPO|nr:unnamed protein product [Clonostachys rhizophaga]